MPWIIWIKLSWIQLLDLWFCPVFSACPSAVVWFFFYQVIQLIPLQPKKKVVLESSTQDGKTLLHPWLSVSSVFIFRQQRTGWLHFPSNPHLTSFVYRCRHALLQQPPGPGSSWSLLCASYFGLYASAGTVSFLLGLMVWPRRKSLKLWIVCKDSTPEKWMDNLFQSSFQVNIMDNFI